MADKSCSSSDFSEGRSCDSGMVRPSDAQLSSAAAAVPASWASVSAANTLASLLFRDNEISYFSYILHAFQYVRLKNGRTKRREITLLQPWLKIDYMPDPLQCKCT